jgi:Zinc finger, ZZ type
MPEVACLSDLKNEEEFCCSICRELLWKPCVNLCGHVFCFWCFHKAMDPWDPSNCPLCRQVFIHFPAVCYKLNDWIAEQFPNQYIKRTEENEQEELEHHAASPSLVLKEPNFHCDSTYCGRLLHSPPMVLNCGHVICGELCISVVGEEKVCPKCSEPVPYKPQPCKLLGGIIELELPSESAARNLEYGAALENAEKLPLWSQNESSVLNKDKEGIEEQIRIEEDEEDEEEEEEEQRQRRRVFSLLKTYKENFVHLGVGCDLCGHYPIKGRRYKCLDCPEEIGFDLCGACFDRGINSESIGRFNQKHTVDHRMELQKPTMSAIHVLRALHPELKTQQLLHLLNVSMEEVNVRDGDSEEGREVSGDAAEDELNLEFEVVDPEEFIGMRRSGPRPAPSEE